MTFWKQLKNSDVIIIAITCIVVALLKFTAPMIRVEILISILGVGISIAFSLRQSRMENDKIFKELFIMYTEKYDRRFNNELHKIINNPEREVDNTLNDEEKSIVTDYLNMCAEQYLWYSKGRIDETVWNAWKKGMQYYLTHNPIINHVKEEKAQKESYYGFFEYMGL